MVWSKEESETGSQKNSHTMLLHLSPVEGAVDGKGKQRNTIDGSMVVLLILLLGWSLI